MVAGWPQLQPDGPGSWDQDALDRCDRALDALLARGTRPALTLLDRSLPPWLDAAGGWLARDTAEHFAAFAAELGRRFGDRVERWITSTDLAGPTLADHVAGMYTPGRGAGRAGLPAVHHILLANGLATQALGATGARAGSAPRSPSWAATRPPTTPTTGSPWSAWRAGPTDSSSTPCCSASTW